MLKENCNGDMQNKITKKQIVAALFLVLLIFGLDIFTKQLAVMNLTLAQELAIVPGFNLHLAYNQGIAFSLGNQGMWWQYYLYILSGIATIIFLIYLLCKKNSEFKMIEQISFLFIIAGAMGNILDRIRFGYVVDFIDLYFKQWHFATFNLADCAISLGVSLLFMVMLQDCFAEKKATN